jgi:hypothetical protein
MMKNILDNIPYNNKKFKKHFPVNIFNTLKEYSKQYNKSNNCNVSFSILSGDFELQKKVILDTIDRRYNTIKAFSNNLKESILKNYILNNFYGIKVMDLINFKDDIIYLNSSDSILKRYPNFINNNDNKKCIFDYVFSIKTENIHHYIDLKNEKLCDRILICGDKNKYNIMFKINNHLNNYKINDYISLCFNNKLLNLSSFNFSNQS